MEVKFKRLHKDAKIPKQASEFAGGWDVVMTELIQEEPDFVICKLGFALQPPFGFKVTLVPRSSITKTKWILQNSPGLGDPDYTGEYQYRFRCLPTGYKGWITYNDGESGGNHLIYDKFPYKIGERIGQIYLEKIIPMDFIEIEELEEMERNNLGFGTTGH